jgi:hypothetical protein
MATKTNETTRDILKFLFTQRVFAWRHNVLPVPVPGGGYRSGGKSGIPDIIGILPDIGGEHGFQGKFFGCEIKTGKDRLRPEQIGFHTTAQKLGAVIMVVKDFNDFQEQWTQLTT